MKSSILKQKLYALSYPFRVCIGSMMIMAWMLLSYLDGARKNKLYRKWKYEQKKAAAI